MNDSHDHLEVEVKFHIAKPDTLHQRLVDLGAVVQQPKVFESNLRFEDFGNTLKANDQLLRLRRDNHCRLTYKRKPSPMDTECKVYYELEVTVSDFDIMRKILEVMGFHQAQVYEKWRQIYRWYDVDICVDTLPYGSFTEIEGAEADIKSTARRLQLPWHKRIRTNYLAMFHALQSHAGLPFNDVTFANFEKHPAQITPLLAQFEAGA